MLDIDYMKTTQFKWDVYLLTMWFKKPAFKMLWVVDNFLRDEKITVEQYIELKRVPRGYIPSSIRVEPFVCSIPKLGSRLYDLKIEDVFDLALKLKNSKIDTKQFSKISMIDRNEHKQDLKDMKRGRSQLEYMHNLHEIQRASNQWHQCK